MSCKGCHHKMTSSTGCLNPSCGYDKPAPPPAVAASDEERAHIHTLDHPCRDTCSGWKQGYEKGLRTLRTENAALVLKCEALQGEVGKLRNALKDEGKWLVSCNQAAYSNLEGADGKEFKYWQEWLNVTSSRIKIVREALGAADREGKDAD